MIINSVSNVGFKGVMTPDEVEKYLNRPQTYSVLPPKQDVQKTPEKKSSVGAALFKTVVVGLVAAGCLVALKHFNITKVLAQADLANANLLNKASHYAGKAGQAMIDFLKPAVDRVRAMF